MERSWSACPDIRRIRKGIDDASYRMAGGEFLQPLVRCFQPVPYWRMDPNHTVVQCDDPAIVTSVLSEPNRQTVMAYLCAEKSGAAVGGLVARTRLPAGEYKVRLLRPADLSPLDTTTIESASLSKSGVLRLPEFTDDLLIVMECTRRGKPARVPGTA